MFNLITTLFREFLNICLLKRAPQDLPASQGLFLITLVASFTGSMLVASSGMAWPAAAQSAVLETLFMLAAIYAMLVIYGRPARWLQTVTAIAGTNTVLVVISLPLLMWLLTLREQQMDATVPSLLFLGLVFWNLLVLGHIFRHALSTYLPVGVMTALGYYLLSIMLVNWLAPTTVTG